MNNIQIYLNYAFVPEKNKYNDVALLANLNPNAHKMYEIKKKLLDFKSET